MRAVVLNEYGPPENLTLVELPDPEPGPRDVLIEVKAAALNPIDWKLRSGAQRAVVRYKLPWVLGLDVAGVVKATGAKVTRFKVGDEVCASCNYKRQGSYAELICVDESLPALKPSNVDLQHAAALPLAGLTAWQALVKYGEMSEGHKVFIQAGAGGVGHMAIQIAKAHGAYVAATCSERNMEWLKELGADLVIDYNKQQYDEVLSDYDIALDSLGGEHRARALTVLRKGGRHVSIVTDLPKMVESCGPVMGTLGAGLKVGGFMISARVKGFKASTIVQRPNGDDLRALCELVEQDKLKLRIDKTFGLDQLAEAHAYGEKGRTRGKIVIDLS